MLKRFFKGFWWSMVTVLAVQLYISWDKGTLTPEFAGLIVLTTIGLYTLLFIIYWLAKTISRFAHKQGQ